MKKLFALNLSKKILLMVLTIITIFCIALFSLYQGVKKESFKERQLKVQHQTETAWTVLDYYAGLEKSGQLNRNDAQTLGITSTVPPCVPGIEFGEQSEYSVKTL